VIEEQQPSAPAIAGSAAALRWAAPADSAPVVVLPTAAVAITSTLPPRDYVARALSRLPSMYRSTDPAHLTNTEKAITALLAPANDLAAAMLAVLTQRNVDTAVGVQLDVIGVIVGRARDGVSDDEIYRRYVRAQISANKSNGSVNDVQKVARLVIGDAGTITTVITGVAASVLRVDGIALSDAVAAVLVELVLRATSDGVRRIVEWTGQDPARTLYWDTAGVWDTAVWFNAADQEL